jgi:predicted nucleic acid-binding Zn ribbon protein
MRDVPRRRAPRSMADVMAGVIKDIAPTDPLSRLQMAWPGIAGRQHAEHSMPSHLRGDGTVVIRCDSGTLASELQLREPQLSAMIAEHLELHCPLRFEGPAGRR